REPRLPELRHRAEEDDPLDVQRSDQGGDRPAEDGPGLVGDLEGPRLAGVEGRPDREEVGRSTRRRGGAGFDGAHAGDRLQAAGPTAAAERPALLAAGMAEIPRATAPPPARG